jgi:opacity protein-like surface antigen
MTARTVFKGGLVLALLVLVALPASAQSQTDQRGYVVGLGGAGTTQVNAPFFGASVGFDVTDHLQITADVGRTQDVLASFTKEDLRLSDQAMLDETGLPSTTSVKMPTNYLTGGVRVLMPSGRYIRPYASASAGIAHMSPAPKFVLGGLDVTSLAMLDPVASTAFREATRPMASLGGGLTFDVARHVMLDIGYRYSGIFIETDYLQDYESSPHSHKRIDTHRVFAGAGFTF